MYFNESVSHCSNGLSIFENCIDISDLLQNYLILFKSIVYILIKNIVDSLIAAMRIFENYINISSPLVNYCSYHRVYFSK